MAIRSKTIDAHGMRFDALSSGPADGELVLLLHGFPQTAECWRPALTSLARAGYHGVAVTQRGYSAGARPDDVDAYRISRLRDDVFAFADALGQDRFHLAGHDWGGTVGWAAASDQTGRVATYTSITTPHSAALARALRRTQQRLRMAYVPVLRAPIIPEALFNAMGGAAAVRLLMLAGQQRNLAERDVATLRAIGPSGALNWYRAVGREPLSAGRVAAPTLHVWADSDPAFGREATEMTAEYVDGPYHLLELQGATHWVPDLHWEDVDDVFLDHLRAHAAS